jgi:adenylate cyclase
VNLKAPPLSGRKARLAIVIAVFALLAAVKQLGGFGSVDRNLFDLMSTTAPPRPQQPGVVIVAIDEQTFSAIGKPWPWPRDVHASLIHALRQAGARTIGFDVVFADPTSPAADEALAAAADSHTIFGADETLAETPQGTMLVRTEALPLFTQSGARQGVTSVAVDADGVVRHIPRYPDSIAQRFLPRPRPSGAGRLIQYFGGPRTYPYVSYYQALDPDRYLPPGMLNGRDVLIGLVVQANPEVRQAPDAFETSFTTRDARLVPGVEIQATIIDNLRHRLWIGTAPEWFLFLLLVAGSVIGFIVAMPDRVATRLLALSGSMVAIVVSAWLILRVGRIWVPPAEALAGVAASAALLGLADFAAERRQRRQIQGAFGQYVSPEIVRRIIEDPERVKLGGERKMITVLFADIRGFTTLAEKLCSEPEELTRFLNYTLTSLSTIVTRHGGTIDKYIGDCVMAFWNAPLDDSNHAANALCAALDMIESVASFTAEISIGIGVNSGECVVGNMGSEQRFDYTVIGDPVNVASRLEGLSKDYRVPLVVGGETVKCAGDRFEFVKLDTVRVRGKQRSEVVYSLRSLISAEFASQQLTGSVDVPT